MINYINETCNHDEGFKATNKSCSIPTHKLPFGISIQILITNYISQYPKNQLSCHESIQQTLMQKKKQILTF